MFREWPIFLAGLAGLAALYLGLHTHIGGSEDHWGHAARYTARVGFPFFIITYSASSLARLWPNDTTRSLLRNRKWWGLAFATTHTVHLYALIHVLLEMQDPDWLYFAPAFFAYAVLYAMALTSWSWAYRTMGKWWKRLHTFGIHYLWLIFAAAYFLRALDPQTRIIGMVAFAIALGALGLRIAVWRRAQAKRA